MVEQFTSDEENQGNQLSDLKKLGVDKDRLVGGGGFQNSSGNGSTSDQYCGRIFGEESCCFDDESSYDSLEWDCEAGVRIPAEHINSAGGAEKVDRVRRRPRSKIRDGIMAKDNDLQDSHSMATGSGKFKRETRAVVCLRFLVLFMLVTATVVVASLTYHYTSTEERDDFETHFRETAVHVAAAFQHGVDTKVSVAAIFSAMYTSRCGRSHPDGCGGAWPNATLPDFREQVSEYGQLELAGARAISFNPVVEGNAMREKWEAHATENADVLGAPSLLLREDGEVHRIVSDGIYRREEDTRLPMDDPGTVPGSRYPDFLVPVWQIAPIESNEKAIMFNLRSVPDRRRALDDMLDYGFPVLTSGLQLVQDSELRPSSILFYPVFDSFNRTGSGGGSGGGSGKVVGSISIVFSWDDMFHQVLPNYVRGIVCVLSTSEGQSYTYDIHGDSMRLIGEGDLHDPRYDHMAVAVNASLRGTDETLGIVKNLVTYRLRMYPSRTFEEQYVTRVPAIYTSVVVLIFFCTSALFLLYDCLVERRQTLVMEASERSSRIVESLFPPMVRDRLLFRHDGGGSLVGDVKEATTVTPTNPVEADTIVAAVEDSCKMSNDSSGQRDPGAERNRRMLGRQVSRFLPSPMNGMVETPAARMKRFLNNIPNGVGGRGRPTSMSGSCGEGSDLTRTLETEGPIADHFPRTTVLFADIAGFTSWSSTREPVHVFHLLETLYREFDRAARRRGVFKVETIGDCYVAVIGLPDPRDDDHAIVMSRFAMDCLRITDVVTRRLSKALGPETANLALRCGMHSGPVTGGVLRGEKSRFQLFGDTMNTASRMESTGEPGRIQISEETAALLIDGGKNRWLVAREGLVQAKGKGELQTYWVSRSNAGGKALDGGGGNAASGAVNMMRRGSSALKEFVRRSSFMESFMSSDAEKVCEEIRDPNSRRPSRASIVRRSILRCSEVSTAGNYPLTTMRRELKRRRSFSASENQAQRGGQGVSSSMTELTRHSSDTFVSRDAERERRELENSLILFRESMQNRSLSRGSDLNKTAPGRKSSRAMKTNVLMRRRSFSTPESPPSRGNEDISSSMVLDRVDSFRSALKTLRRRSSVHSQPEGLEIDLHQRQPFDLDTFSSSSDSSQLAAAFPSSALNMNSCLSQVVPSISAHSSASLGGGDARTSGVASVGELSFSSSNGADGCCARQKHGCAPPPAA